MAVTIEPWVVVLVFCSLWSCAHGLVPYKIPTTNFTGMTEIIDRHMKAGWLTGFIQRHTYHDGYTPEASGALLRQQLWRRANKITVDTANQDYSFLDCTPMFEVERSWTTLLMNVHVRTVLCVSVCLDYPICTTSLPVLLGQEDKALKTTQLCNVTVLGATNSTAATTIKLESETTQPGQLCRNLVDVPRAFQSSKWSTVSTVVKRKRRFGQFNFNAKPGPNIALRPDQTLRAITVKGPTARASPMITFPDLWAHLIVQPMQLFPTGKNAGWYVLKDVNGTSIIKQAMSLVAVANHSGPVTTEVSGGLLVLSFSRNGWKGVDVLMPVKAAHWSQQSSDRVNKWAVLHASAVDGDIYPHRANGTCHDTWDGVVKLAKCLQRQKTTDPADVGEPLHSKCLATSSSENMVFFGKVVVENDGTTRTPTDIAAVCERGEALACSNERYTYRAPGESDFTWGKYDKKGFRVFELVSPDSAWVALKQHGYCPWWAATSGGYTPMTTGISKTMYGMGATYRHESFLAAGGSQWSNWSAGTLGDDVLKSNLQLVNLSAVSGKSFNERLTEMEGDGLRWSEAEVLKRISERLATLAVESGNFTPPLPSEALFLTAMSAQMVAAASVFGKDLTGIDSLILTYKTYFPFWLKSDGSPALARWCVLALAHVGVFYAPFVPATYAAYRTLSGQNKDQLLSAPSSVQYLGLEGDPNTQLMLTIHPVATVSVNYTVYGVVTGVLTVFLLVMSVLSTRKAWALYLDDVELIKKKNDDADQDHVALLVKGAERDQAADPDSGPGKK